METESSESFIDTMINSVKYGVSDMRTLFWGGVVALLSMFLVGIPFMLGYLTRCARYLLNGNKTLPAWDDLGGMLKDGIMVIAIGVVYALVAGLLYVLVMPFFIAGGLLDSTVLYVLGVIVAVPVILLEIALSLLFYLSWMEYAATGDLARSLNPVRGLKLIAANPAGYILALVSLFIIGLVLSIPSVLIITIPWVTFVTYVANAYIYTRFYQKANRTQTGSLPAVPAGTA